MDPQSTTPEIRCRQIQDDLKALDLLDAAVKKQVLSLFPKDKLKIIQDTREDQWLPVEYDVELTECVAKEIGEKGVFEWNQKAFSFTINSSMVGSFFRSALCLFRVKPSATFKLYPYVWNSIFRNCGNSSLVSKGHGHIQLIFKDLAPAIAGSRPYLIGLSGAAQFMLSFTKSKGQVVLEHLSKENQSAIIQIKWEPDI